MRILVSALEPSSNLHLKALLPHLKNTEIVGLFDKKLGTPLYTSDEFNVMGIIDVVPKILRAKEIISDLTFLAKDVDKILLIDAPAFNLPLAKSIKKLLPNIEITYFILPKVWAWKKNRIYKLEKYCDRLVSIFPFEADIFNKKIEYIGNPLMDEIKVFKNELTQNNKIAFLAGSRKREIKSLMPIFRSIQEKLNKKAILVIPPHLTDTQIKEFYGNITSFNIIKDTHIALEQSDFAFICSGTATLESALIGTPFILVYKTNFLEYFIGKIFVSLPYVGLANLIFYFNNEKIMHPECLQTDVSVQGLLQLYEEYDNKNFLNQSIELRDKLKNNTFKRLAYLLSKEFT